MFLSFSSSLQMLLALPRSTNNVVSQVLITVIGKKYVQTSDLVPINKNVPVNIHFPQRSHILLTSLRGHVLQNLRGKRRAEINFLSSQNLTKTWSFNQLISPVCAGVSSDENFTIHSSSQEADLLSEWQLRCPLRAQVA